MQILNDTTKADHSPVLHDFESVYISTREKENRIYTDEQVAFLPSINVDHVHYKEWQVRKRSAARLYNYLQHKLRPLSILEVGCGNGWLSSKLSVIRHAQVTGIDINKKELSQAKRVFCKKENIQFLYGDIRAYEFQNKKFDMIVLPASIQYFSSAEGIINTSLSLLNKNGEIHITDTNFYTDLEKNDALKRSELYYHKIGHEAMNDFYFHHSFTSLKNLNYKILFDPASLKNKLFRKDPFPWIMITP